MQSECAAQLTLSKHVQGARVAAYFMYASGAAFIAIAIIGYMKEPHIFMPHLFAVVFGAVLSISGMFFHRVASTRAQRPNQTMQRTPTRRSPNISHD